jgi:hypothetical protein
MHCPLDEELTPMPITVLRPDEAPPTTDVLELAPRHAPPDQLTVGLVANGKPLAKELLSALAEGLGVRAGREVAVVMVEKPSAAFQLEDDEADRLASLADVAIAGLGDCGACSTCSLYDAVMLERRGIPATVLITEPFQSLIASLAAKLGAPGYHTLSLPHPVWGKTEEKLRVLVDPAVETAAGQLLQV